MWHSNYRGDLCRAFCNGHLLTMVALISFLVNVSPFFPEGCVDKASTEV